jgi:hypothetical protein
MWKAFGASRQGSSHVGSGTPCQDCHGFKVIAGTGIIATVADGLGSALHADRGAQLAVDGALTYVANVLAAGAPADEASWIQLLKETVQHCRRNLFEYAGQESLPPGNFGTTLIVVIMTETHLALAHIGDGAVVSREDDGALQVLSGGVRGEYANETVPITAFDALERGVFGCFPAPQSIALMTDGLQKLAMNLETLTPFRPFYVPYWKALDSGEASTVLSAQLAEYLDSERFNQVNGTDDDKTILLVGRSRGTGSKEPA